jgi:hypothetical protein
MSDVGRMSRASTAANNFSRAATVRRTSGDLSAAFASCSLVAIWFNARNARRFTLVRPLNERLDVGKDDLGEVVEDLRPSQRLIGGAILTVWPILVPGASYYIAPVPLFWLTYRFPIGRIVRYPDGRVGGVVVIEAPDLLSKLRWLVPIESLSSRPGTSLIRSARSRSRRRCWAAA